MSLIISKAVSALFKCLTDSDNATVTENTEDSVYELRFLSVKADILIVKESDKSLSHCKFHAVFSFFQNYASGGQIFFSFSSLVTQRCSGIKYGVIYGFPSRLRIVHKYHIA